MTPKSRRFKSGFAAATVGAGATAAVLLIAPAISGAAESPAALVAVTDTTEVPTTDDTAPEEGTAEQDVDAGSGGDSEGSGRGGPGGPEFPGRPGGGPGRVRFFDGEVIARAIGIDVEVLREELRSGSTVAEIAAANEVDNQVVIDALVAEFTERVTAWIEGEQPAVEAVPDTDDAATTETTVA